MPAAVFIPLPLIFLFVLLWGLSLGSFTTCVVYRVPRGLSLWRNEKGSMRSFCPDCGAELHAKDLIPVFSFLWQRGRCRYCGRPIPPRYLWIELSVLAATLLLGIMFGLSLRFFIFSLCIPLMTGLVLFFRKSSRL